MPRVQERDVKPGFDTSQSEKHADAILSDNQSHKLLVLFKDNHGIRVRQGSGHVKDKRGHTGLDLGRLSEEGRGSLAAVFNQAGIEKFSPLYDRNSEADLLVEEAKYEQLSGVDFPNAGSYAVVSLSDFTRGKGKGLYNALKHHPAVRRVSILGQPRLAAIHYKQPPLDDFFPDASNWQAEDLNNPYTFTPVGLEFRSRRHFFH